MLSMTTDYAGVSRGDAGPYLQRIAEAGFPAIHWCHEWCTDTLYRAEEIRRIRAQLRALRLDLVDLHASHGQTCHYYAVESAERRRGVALLLNRLEMVDALGGRAAVLHPPILPADGAEALWDACRRGVDEVEPFLRRTGLRLAFENLASHASWDVIARLCDAYGADVVGLCFDAGHANLIEGGVGELDRLRDRIVALHLHDNEGQEDRHWHPFDGSMDWPAFASVLAASPYAGPLTQESNVRQLEDKDELRFLGTARERGSRLARLVQDAAARPPRPPASRLHRAQKAPPANGDAPASTAAAPQDTAPPPTTPGGLIVDPIEVAKLLPGDFRTPEKK